MKIAIGNDHVAVEMKNHIKAYLEEKGHDVVRIDKCDPIEWLYHAYIKDPNKRFKKWWYKKG